MIRATRIAAAEIGKTIACALPWAFIIAAGLVHG